MSDNMSDLADPMLIQNSDYFASLFRSTSTFEDDYSLERTTRVVEDAFERAKASASYGIGATIQYALILPLKEMIIGLTAEEAADLDLYTKHTALCSGIEKVQSAYKTYIAAQDAAHQTESIPARHRAIKEGEALVNNYSDLIWLAINQAADMRVDKTTYLADLHQKLDKETHGHILYTVNSIRPKRIEKDCLEYDSKSIFRDHYLKFVTEFVSNVEDAWLQSSRNSSIPDITDAFIQGLATIPELGDGTVLIDFYDALHNQQDQIADGQDKAIQHFKKQIEDLMKRYYILPSDLQSIQYQGIPLLSVIETFSTDQLNTLRNLGNQVNRDQGSIQKAQEQIAKDEAFIKESNRYSFNDVRVFLNDAGVANLEDIPQEDTALGNLSKDYKKALKEYNEITKEIKETTERQTQAKAVREEEIEKNKAELKKADAEVARLQKILDEEALQLEAKQKELEAFQKDRGVEIKKLSAEKSSQKMKEMKIAGFNKECDAEEAKMNEEIKALRESRSQNVKTQELESAKAFELIENDIKLTEADELASEKEAETLKGLKDRLKKVEKREVAQLRGEDIATLANHFKIEGCLVSKNPISKRLGGVEKAQAAIRKAKSETLTMENRILDNTATMTEISPFLTLNNKGDFVLDVAIFGDREKTAIASQLESNLTIAKKVTMQVGRKIIAQHDEFALQKAEENKGSLRDQRMYANMESPLKAPLDAREKQDEDKEDLYQLVSDRVVSPSSAVKMAEVIQSGIAQLSNLGNTDEYLLLDDNGMGSEKDPSSKSHLIVDPEDAI